ncbi:MAG: hypothetical protein MRECE_22c027 [Mycoplasmataceae bacterium CE_OT135]|nr:MAG: hypothetical protein MRECE_22c027 [Mycoplasmataceae bacterium CE_OT135]
MTDYIDAIYGVKKNKKVREEAIKYCPNCRIEIRKNEFVHDVYKTMFPCVLQWDQLSSLPNRF